VLSETSSSASGRISMIKEKLTVEVVTVIDDQLKVQRKRAKCRSPNKRKRATARNRKEKETV
jgi:hypothetical protein